MFKKGKPKTGGRQKGVLNKEDRSNLRSILNESFRENRPWIKECLAQMLNDCRKHLTEINTRIANVDEKSDEYTGTLRFLVATRTALLEEFKWLLSLKASLEPKNVEVSGPNGGDIPIPQLVNVFVGTPQEVPDANARYIPN